MSTNCGCEPKKYIMSCCTEPVLGPIQNYYTKYQIDRMISSVTTSAVTKQEMNEAISSAKTEIEAEIPSLSGYATEEWVTDQHYITGVDLSNYATLDDIPSLDGYATTEQMNQAISAATSGFTSIINELENEIIYLRRKIVNCCPGNKVTYTTSAETYTIACDSSATLTTQEMVSDMSSHGFGTPPLYNYSVREVEIGDCVTHIGDNVFNDMFSVISVIIPNTVTAIGNQSFKNNGFSAITIPSSVTSIGSNAFYGCENLASVEVPSGVTSVDAYTFSNCIRLRNIVIPSTVTSIGDNAFYLTQFESTDPRYSVVNATARDRVVTILATTPPVIGTNVFAMSSGDPTYKIKVPQASVNAYKQAWSHYADRIIAIN